MASSLGLRKYPYCLYEVGKTPIQNRSMNRQMVEETAEEDVWSEMRESTIRITGLDCEAFDKQDV
ncbi:unnamed protein product [Brassica oleracea]|uniref:(rape) hypothetical protein n=1 Tax=Brassica napus TaxID=3708 RepID=A0A816L6E9_BRANA|nr:unnamed protein product [Brassica napus]